MNTISTCIGLVVGYFTYKAGIATIGTVFLFIMYIDLIFRPVMQLVQQLEDLQNASVAIQRIDELYSLKPTIIDGNLSELPALLHLEVPTQRRFQDYSVKVLRKIFLWACLRMWN